MRDGLPQRFVGQPPRSKERQRRHKDPEVKRKEKKKIDKARKHGYIVTKFVGITRSFMHFFSVPKGDDDIRMVYDGSRSGLNEVLWAPWFALPTVTSMCRTIDVGYWCADNDFGEMFLIIARLRPCKSWHGARVVEWRKHWKEAQECVTPHVPLAMAGRFKKHVGENQYFQPLANVTASGLNIQKWMFRAITTYESLGVVDGPMFRLASSGCGAKVKRCAMGDLNPAFHALLKRVQDRWPNVIPANVDVEAEYDIARSEHRGVTAHAQNQCIPKEMISANNRWRKHEKAGGMRSGMCMMEHYSDAKASVKMLIRFSQEL